MSKFFEGRGQETPFQKINLSVGWSSASTETTSTNFPGLWFRCVTSNLEQFKVRAWCIYCSWVAQTPLMLNYFKLLWYIQIRSKSKRATPTCKVWRSTAFGMVWGMLFGFIWRCQSDSSDMVENIRRTDVSLFNVIVRQWLPAMNDLMQPPVS